MAETVIIAGAVMFIEPGKESIMLIQELRERKRELGYSYETISELSGVPLGTVQKVLTGATKAPRQKTLDALKKVLCVRDEFLFQKNENTEKPGSYTDQAGARQGEPSVVRESITYGTFPYAPDEFGLTNGKHQGEYTIDDYRHVPDDLRVELIAGSFYIMEAPGVGHQLYSGELYTQLKQYILSRKGNCIPLYAPVDVQLHCDEKTVLQPDVLILCDRSKIQNGIVYGAPDFLAEVVSPSSGRKDYMIKMAEYMRAGVREYWIIDPEKKKVIVYAWGGMDVSPAMYGFRDRIPVSIYDGDCVIDFAQIDDYVSAVLGDRQV